MSTLKYADKPWFQHDMLVNDYALPLASENEILIEKTPFYSQEDFDQQIRVAARLKAMKIRVSSADSKYLLISVYQTIGLYFTV